MSEAYLSLSKNEQSQILRSLSMNRNINRNAIVLEKDIWICWALEFLFKMPNSLPMAFKGGTSLSKAFRIIERFSEDLDITIDYKAFNCEDPFSDGVSKTRIKNISDQLKLKVSEYLKNSILPYFERIISEQFKETPPTMSLGDDGETLFLNYPSAIERQGGYIRDAIKLEFGGRNITIPSDMQIIKADISDHIKDLSFPSTEVRVLSPQKTYWEKITLIHYECNRLPPKDNADRISRHWYDIAMLANHNIGNEAAANRALLNEVIKVKKIFYNSSFAKYDDCLSGNLRLIPDDNLLKRLEKDFNAMLDNKMFYGEQPSFNSIISDIQKLESNLNQSI
jgi:predicted nucleotidyltransferase component of viral defense system